MKTLPVAMFLYKCIAVNQAGRANYKIMMKERLHPELSTDERARLLRDSCDEVVDGYSYTRRLSEEELEQLRHELSEKQIRLSDLEEQRKEAMDGFKEQMNPLKERSSRVITMLKNKSVSACERVFKLIDYDERMVGYYNSEGELVHSRRMYEEEKQTTVFRQIAN